MLTTSTCYPRTLEYLVRVALVIAAAGLGLVLALVALVLVQPRVLVMVLVHQLLRHAAAWRVSGDARLSDAPNASVKRLRATGRSFQYILAARLLLPLPKLDQPCGVKTLLRC